MALVQSINSFGQFLAGIPETRLTQFSYYGWQLIFNYLEDLSDDIGEDIEIDYIGICCEYCEYTSIEDFRRAYPDFDDEVDENDIDAQLWAIQEYLEQRTTVICCEENCILFMEF